MFSYFSFVIFLFFWNVSPGPNSTLISRSSIKYGFKGGLSTLIGFLICDSFYLTLSFLGVSEFISKHPLLFYYVKVLGSIYILYIGITIILESFTKKENALFTESTTSEQFSFKKNFMRGLFTDLSNPFTIVGMTSFIVQFFKPEMLFSQKVLYALTVPALSLICYGIITLMFGNLYVRKIILSKILWFERATGIILSYMAVTMMLF